MIKKEMIAEVKFEQRGIPIMVDGVLKYTPAIKLGNGDFNPISQQGNVLIYDTKEEAEEYFED